MAFKVYPEKVIRKQILAKVKPTVKNKGKHTIGQIIIDSVIISPYLKIPNNHKDEFHIHKAKKLAQALCIDSHMYNGLIDCNVKGNDYYQHLRDTQF